MLIGLAGLAGSGKDTSAEFLKNITGFDLFAYADKPKEFISELFKTNISYFYNQELKKVHLSFALDRKDFYSHFIKTCSQILSIEDNVSDKLFDDTIDVFTWNGLIIEETEDKLYISATPRELMQRLGSDVFRSYDDDFWIKFRPQVDSLIISDVRFHNESQDVTRIGGIILLIDRKTNTEKMNHDSEKVDIGSDYIVVDNNGSIEDLENKLKTIYETRIKPNVQCTIWIIFWIY